MVTVLAELAARRRPSLAAFAGRLVRGSIPSEATRRLTLVRSLDNALERMILRREPFFVAGARRIGGPKSRQVLIATHDLSASGGPRIVAELTMALVRADYDVVVVSPKEGPLLRPLLALGAAVVVDPDALSTNSETVRSLARASDVAFCNTIVTRGVVCASYSILPTFWYIHEVSLVDELLRADDGIAAELRLPYEVWCGSEQAAMRVRGQRGDVRVVPYGLDTIVPASRPTHATGRKGMIRISVFGSIESRKGQDLAVDAVRCLPATALADLHLTFYGRTLDQGLEDSLRARSRDLPITFGGELGPGAYRRAMLRSDIVLVPSRDDTLPLVSLDALGAKRILACTPTTGTGAYLENGVDGFVAAAATGDAIAAMLTRVIERRGDWAAIGGRGAALFARTFSKDRFAEVVVSSATRAIADRRNIG